MKLRLVLSSIEEVPLGSLAQRLEDKYGKGSVKVVNNALSVAMEGPNCVCGHCDCWGPEHAHWCPLYTTDPDFVDKPVITPEDTPEKPLENKETDDED